MSDYFAKVPRKAGQPFSAPPTAREPDAATILGRASTEGEWLVPVEMALATSSSVMVSLIRTRHARGERISKNARVICRGNRYFATVFFPDATDLFLALDCWSMEEGA